MSRKECEGCSNRRPLAWILPDFDQVVLVGEVRLPPSISRATRGMNVEYFQDAAEGRLTMGYVLARANELEIKSRKLLEKYKLH